MTKIPSPFVIMKASKRILDFEKNGEPIHPLIDQGLPVVLKKQGKGEFKNWGANFMTEALVLQNDKVLLQKKGDNWILPVGISVDDKKWRIVYSNLNNFTQQTTRNAWLETTVYKLKLKKGELFETSTGDTKWFNVNDLPNMSDFHKIIIHQHL